MNFTKNFSAVLLEMAPGISAGILTTIYLLIVPGRFFGKSFRNNSINFARNSLGNISRNSFGNVPSNSYQSISRDASRNFTLNYSKICPDISPAISLGIVSRNSLSTIVEISLKISLGFFPGITFPQFP